MKSTKIEIINIHKSDAWYSERHEIYGLVGYAENIVNVGHEWYSFDFLYLGQYYSFSCANFQLVKE